MDQTAVKNVFREKLQTVFTPALLEDADIVGITLLIGYRMYLGKCDNQQAQNILNEAISDEAVVKTLISYFNNYAEENKKRIEAEKAEKTQVEKKVNETKSVAEPKKQQSRKQIKVLVKAKKIDGKQQEGQGESLSNTIQMPDPTKQIKTSQGEKKQEEEPQVVALATQLKSQGKVKCKYFPFCKNQPCEYFHPTQKCPYFPRCKFAQACMYLHEACKYGQNCTRNNCFYDHPFKKKFDNPMVEFMKMAMGQMKNNKRPIRKRKPTEDGVSGDKPIDKAEKHQQQK